LSQAAAASSSPRRVSLDVHEFALPPPAAVPARAPAGHELLQALQQQAPDLVGVLPHGFQLRTAQAHHMLSVGGGDDFIGVAATATGKSLNLFVAAAADALAARRRDGESRRALLPVTLVAVPFANLGPSLEEAGQAFLFKVAGAHFPGWEQERFFPRVLYAERKGDGSSVNDASGEAVRKAIRTCPAGHKLHFYANEHSARGKSRKARCDRCGVELKRSDRRGGCSLCDWDICVGCASGVRRAPEASDGQAQDLAPQDNAGLPRTLPCGMCIACTDPGVKRQKFRDGCVSLIYPVYIYSN
jgi:hypothetical protein